MAVLPVAIAADRLPRLRSAIACASRRPALRTFSSVAAAVGQTPLIELRRASKETGCTILGKAEFLNPGQSVKDRAALYIIEDAVRRGTLRPGGTVVEGTAGNTGIGLTVIGSALGFKSVIVIPETQTQEKKDVLRLLGARLVEVPAVPYKNPDNYVKYSGRLAEALSKAEPRAPSGLTSSIISPTGRPTSRPRLKRSGRKRVDA